ncbi:MAG: ATP-binding protein [Nitrospirota bacterium]
MTASPPSWPMLLHRVLAGAASVTALVVGCLAFLGWAFDLGSMHNVASGLPAMTPMMSVAIILAGASLWLAQAERTRRQHWCLATVCSLGVIVVGTVILVGYTLEWDIGRDRLLDEEAVQALEPGRMAPVMAFALLNVGGALLVWESPLGAWLTRGIGLLAALFSVVPIVASLFELSSEGRSFSGADPSATMASPAALTLMVLSVGVFSLRRHDPAPASRKVRSVLALKPFRFMGVILALSVAAVSAVGYLSYLQSERILLAEYTIRLGVLADERQQAFARIIGEQLTALKQIAQGAPVQDVARRLRSAKQASPRATLSEVQASTSFHGLLLAVAPGSTRHAAWGSFEGTSLGRWDADMALALKEPLVHFEREDDGKLVLLLGVPVEDPAMPSRPLGVLLANASTVSTMDLFASRVGLGTTGESFLADRLGRPLTNLRYSRPSHGEGSAHEITADAMRRCLQGERSSLAITPDYENVPTVMAYRNVPEIGGGCLMVHIRADEVFAVTSQLQAKRLSLIGLALFIVIGSMLLIGTRMFRDIFRERLRQSLALRREAERRQRLQLSVSQILMEQGTVEETISKLLATIGEGMGWHLGRYWMLQPAPNAPRCVAMWAVPAVLVDESVSCDGLINGSSGISFSGPPLGGGSRLPTWDTDLDKDCPRESDSAAAAAPAGMRCRLCIPILGGGEVLALLEFFSRDPRPRKDIVLWVMRDLGIKVGQFLVRLRAEEQLQRATDQAAQAAREKAEILAAAAVFFVRVGQGGGVTEWTPRAADIFSIPPSEALGRPFEKLPIQWNWGEILGAIGKANETLKSIQLDKIRLDLPEGETRFLKLILSPIQDGCGGMSHVLMGEDVTERFRLEYDLAQAQKLESIGHLAAGIAHEINTPTQFVGDNLRFLSDSLTGLLTVLARHRELLASAKTGACAPDIIEACELESQRADLDYLTEELPKAIAQSAEGTDRIAKIVRAMKDFAHPGSEEKACVDLNKAIGSTVEVSRNEWKYVADLTTDLAPDLPLVPCLQGPFNQVILNLIVNAAHAIGDVVESTGQKGIISITSRRVDDWAEIRITDNGTGIPEHIRHKIFDPFFTTKEVGKGTGQGLAIARSVVVGKHHGMITVESQVGQGTTFIIRLPVQGSGERREMEEREQAA